MAAIKPGDFEGSRIRSHSLAPFEIRAVTVTDKGQQVERHTHEHSQFMLVLAGTYLCSASGEMEPVRPPFLIFEPAGTIHADCFSDRTGAFVAAVLSRSMDTEDLSPTAIAVRNPAALSAAFALAREARCGSTDPVRLEGAAWELVAQSLGKAAPRSTPRWAYNAFDLVMDEAADPDLSISALAGRLDVHPVHLARVFRATWGCAPADLLRWRRLERAADLLATTDRTGADIAAAVGFADQSHMNRAFSARHRTSPARWRRAVNVAIIQEYGVRAD